MEKILKDKIINTFIEIDPERCKGCGLCVEACPEKVIDFSSKFNSKGWIYVEPFYNEKCTGCRRCAIVCPDVAIKVIMEVKPIKENVV
ncbi:MAG: 4Fe-4S dicluster domain-containing protein [Brevinematia bacterium]